MQHKHRSKHPVLRSSSPPSKSRYIGEWRALSPQLGGSRRRSGDGRSACCAPRRPVRASARLAAAAISTSMSWGYAAIASSRGGPAAGHSTSSTRHQRDDRSARQAGCLNVFRPLRANRAVSPCPIWRLSVHVVDGRGRLLRRDLRLTGSARTADVSARGTLHPPRGPEAALRALMAEPQISQLVLDAMTERLVRTSSADLPRLAGVDQQSLRGATRADRRRARAAGGHRVGPVRRSLAQRFRRRTTPLPADRQARAQPSSRRLEEWPRREVW